MQGFCEKDYHILCLSWYQHGHCVGNCSAKYSYFIGQYPQIL